MGFPKNAQADSGLESEGKKWVIAGISIKTTLKPVNTKPKGKKNSYKEVEETDEGEEEQISTTPTAKESRIPEKLPCPPAPRKRRPSRCNYNSGVREFFTHPDLETVFKCYIEKAN